MPAYRFPISKPTQESILDIWKGFIGELMWEVSPLKVLLVLLFYRSMLDGTKVLECSWTFLTSYPGHVGGGKSGLVSTVCACAKNPMILWGIIYHHLQTVNLYRIAPKHVRLQLILRTAGKR